MNDMVNDVTRLFEETFSASPAVIARAPGRVEVLGNHTDYNEGVVLSCAIDKEIYVAAAPNPAGDTFELVSSQFPERLSISELVPRPGNKWINYPLGVCAQLRLKGYSCPGFRLAVHGNIPLGSGLSSSAALEVSTALALCRLYSFDIPPRDLALLCQKAENIFAGAQCGLLDQFSSLFGKKGHLLFIDFRSLDYETVPLGNQDIILALAVSGVTHTLAESGYNERRDACMQTARFFNGRDKSVKALRDVSMEQLLAADGTFDPVALQRARHVIGENQRVFDGIRLLKQGALKEFGNLLYESHESSRLYFENSCPELDRLVDIARSVDGVYGSRLSGGGWGGATISFVNSPAFPAFERSVRAGYRGPHGNPAAVYGVHITDGASVML